MRNKFFILIFCLLISIYNNAQSFKSLYFESMNYLEVYDFESALPILEKMYELDPENANTCFTLGNCLMNMPHREKKRLFLIMKKQWKV